MASFVYDEFNDGSVGAQWTIDNGTGGSISEGGGSLNVATGSGEVWSAAFDPTWAYQAGITGNFDIICRMTVDSLTANTQQGGFLIRLDDSNWWDIVLLHGSTLDGDIVIGSRVRTGGTAAQRLQRYATRGLDRTLGGNYYIYFRIQRVGTEIYVYYSGYEDGRWVFLKPADRKLTTSAAVDIGLMGIHPGGSQTTFRFDWVRENTTGIIPIDDEFTSAPYDAGNTEGSYLITFADDQNLPAPYNDRNDWRYTNTDSFPWEHPPNIYMYGSDLQWDGGSGHQEITWTGIVPSGANFIVVLSGVNIQNNTGSEGWGVGILIRSATNPLISVKFDLGVMASARKYRLRWNDFTGGGNEILTSRTNNSLYSLELTRTGSVFSAEADDAGGSSDINCGSRDIPLLEGDVVISLVISAWGQGREDRPSGNIVFMGFGTQGGGDLLRNGEWFFDNSIWEGFNMGGRDFTSDNFGSHKQNYQIGTHTFRSGKGLANREAAFPGDPDYCYIYKNIDDDFDVYTKVIFPSSQTWKDYYYCGLVFFVDVDNHVAVNLQGKNAYNRAFIQHYKLLYNSYSTTTFDPGIRKDTVWLRMKRDMSDGLVRGFYSYTEPLEDLDWTERNPGTQFESWMEGKLGVFANNSDPGGGGPGPQYDVDFEFFRNWISGGPPVDDPTEERETRACSTCPSGSGSGFDGLLLHFNEDPFIDSSTNQSKTLSASGVGGSGYFPGNAWVEIPEANVWQAEGDAFAADMRVSHRTTPIGTEVYASLYEDNDNRWHLRHINDGGGVNFLYRRNGTDVINLSGAGGRITDTLEHHVAVTQDNDTYRLYLDGTLIDSDSFIDESFYLVDSPLYIGAKDGTTDFFYGDLVNLRMSKGTSRWTQQSFTPMTSGYYETDRFTQLLLFADPPELVDISDSGLAVWNPGQVVWGNRDVGTRIIRFGDYCGYFPGTQDGVAPYAIQLADNVNWYLKDDDFTLDAWVHPLSHFNYAGIIHQNTRWYWYIDSAGKLNWYIEDAGPPTFSMQSSGTVPIDEWSHIALTRSLELTGAGPDIPGFDGFMLPDSDVSGFLSTFGSGTGRWGRCNSGIFGGTPDDTNGMFGLEGDDQRFGFTNPSFTGTTTQIKVHIRAKDFSSGPTDFNVTLYSDGASSDGTRNIGTTGSYVNYTETFSIVKTAAQLTNLEVNISPEDGSFDTQFSEVEVELVGASIPSSPTPGTDSLGQVWRMYIKGVIQAQEEENFTIPNLTGPLWIGRGTSTADLFHGYMQELRLLLGKAVWTDNEFWPYDYPYFSEPVGLYVPTYRRRIHSIKGKGR